MGVAFWSLKFSQVFLVKFMIVFLFVYLISSEVAWLTIYCLFDNRWKMMISTETSIERQVTLVDPP